MSTKNEITSEARNWLMTMGFTVDQVAGRSWPQSDNVVFKLSLVNRSTVYLKQYASPLKFRQSLNAYQHWLSGLNSPTLISANPQEQILLLTDAGDCCCPWSRLTITQQRQIQTQAGIALRGFHEAPSTDDDKIPIGNAVFERVVALQRRLSDTRLDRDLISPDSMQKTVREIETLVPLMNQFGRVPCHRDFWNRNWIWHRPEKTGSDELRLHVIDFEHARMDLRLFDFMKNWSTCWAQDASLADAFWDGYGRKLNSDEHVVIKQLAKVHAVQTILWAIDHEKFDFIEDARRLLSSAQQ